MQHSYRTNVFPYTFDTPYQESSSFCRVSIITSKWTCVPESSKFRPRGSWLRDFRKSNCSWSLITSASFLILIIITCVRCQVLTKDSVTVSVDAVVYFRVSNATMSVTNVENAPAQHPRHQRSARDPKRPRENFWIHAGNLRFHIRRSLARTIATNFLLLAIFNLQLLRWRYIHFHSVEPAS